MKSEVIMGDENRLSDLTEPTVRITRARVKALGSSSGLPPLHPSSKQDYRPVLRARSKRAASVNKEVECSAACPPNKKRAILKDVTNIGCDNLNIHCINAARGQFQPSRQNTSDSSQKKRKVATPCFPKKSKTPGDRQKEHVNDEVKVDGVESQDSSTRNFIIEPTEFASATVVDVAELISTITDSSNCIPLTSSTSRDDVKFCMEQEILEGSEITDIDSKHTDPQMCSPYAADIYSAMYARQIDRRPLVDYMKKLQRDITEGMRAILIDWLVEVSEEYGLMPDTLYLTVNLIDRFLSENCVTKQKLQLLGVTCMLIASKYEEICAPRVEEFCFITDNTYKKDEVVKMESCVLNFLEFQLSVPTTKKFLRRFIQAAQVSYKVPSVELEFLANYLAELSLMDYSFVKYLPSIIAASAVFLAKWTLDQSVHPWNPTLEYYTRHKASELKSVILQLQHLHLHSSGNMPCAIRQKYKQSKFKCVSTLRSSEPIESLF